MTTTRLCPALAVLLVLGFLCLPALGAPPPETAPLALDLDTAVSMALAGNLGLKAAYQSIEQALGARDESSAAFKPQLNLTGSYNRSQPNVQAELPAVGAAGLVTPRTVVIVPVDSFAARLALSQLISSFGKLEQGRAAVALGVDQARQEYQVNRQDIIYQTRVAYFRLLLAQGTQEVADDQLQLATEQLRQTKDLYREGVVSQYDVLRMELILSAARQQMVEAGSGVKQSRETLLNLMGLGLDQEVSLQDPGDPEILKLDPAAARARALANRPELAVTRTAIEAASHRLLGARAGRNPDLSVGTAYTSSTATAFNPPEQWTAMLLFQMALNDGGLTAARTRQMEAALAALQLSLQDLVRQVTTQVDQALRELDDSSARLEASAQDVKMNREGLRMARLRFREGLAGSLELGDAIYSYVKSRNNNLAAICRYRSAVAALQKAMGKDDLPHL